MLKVSNAIHMPYFFPQKKGEPIRGEEFPNRIIVVVRQAFVSLTRKADLGSQGHLAA